MDLISQFGQRFAAILQIAGSSTSANPLPGRDAETAHAQSVSAHFLRPFQVPWVATLLTTLWLRLSRTLIAALRVPARKRRPRHWRTGNMARSGSKVERAWVWALRVQGIRRGWFGSRNHGIIAGHGWIPRDAQRQAGDVESEDLNLSLNHSASSALPPAHFLFHLLIPLVSPLCLPPFLLS